DDSGSNPDTRPDWGVAGRAELQVIGEKFKGYADYTARDQETDLLVIGTGVDNSQTGNMNLVTYTVDAQFENTHGLGLFGAVLGRHATNFDTNSSATIEELEDVSDIGFLVQASQMLGVRFMKADWEV